MAEPGFDASDNIWRCAAPCFFELFRGECDQCGKSYELSPEMEEHDQQLLLEDYPVDLHPAVRWTRPPSPWLTKEDWLDMRCRKSPYGSSADDEPFRQFLSERGVTEEMLDRFDVEWSPVDELVARLDAETADKFAGGGFAFVKPDREKAPGLEDLIIDSEQDGPRIWRVALGETVELSTADVDGKVYLHWLLDECLYQAERFSATASTRRGPPWVTTYSESIHGLAEYFARPRRENETTEKDGDVLQLKLTDGTLISLVQPVPYDELTGLADFEEELDQLPGETDPGVIVVVGSSSPLPGAGGQAAAEDDDDDLVWVT